MPDNWLNSLPQYNQPQRVNLSDVYRQPTTQDMIQIATLGDTVETNRLANRVNFLKVQEAEQGAKDKEEMRNFLKQKNPGVPAQAAQAQYDAETKLQQAQTTETFNKSIEAIVSGDSRKKAAGMAFLKQVAPGIVPAELTEETAPKWAEEVQAIGDKHLPPQQTMQELGAVRLKYAGDKEAQEGIKAQEDSVKVRDAMGTKNLSKEVLTSKALKGDQEAKAILDEMQRRDLDIAKQKGAISVNVATAKNSTQQADNFKTWSPEEKKWHFDQSVANPGYKPDFGWGKSAAESRKSYQRELAQYAMGKGISGAEQQGQKATYIADSSALKDLRKREELIGTFVNRIDATSGVVEKLYKQVGNTDNRLLNKSVNSIKSVLGSGDWQSLQLALTSLSNEIAKVESGSLGIAAVPVEQSKIMSKIHDGNLSLADMRKIIQTGKDLGKTSKGSIRDQVKELQGKMSGKTTETPPKGKAQTVGRFTVEVE